MVSSTYLWVQWCVCYIVTYVTGIWRSGTPGIFQTNEEKGDYWVFGNGWNKRSSDRIAKEISAHFLIFLGDKYSTHTIMLVILTLGAWGGMRPSLPLRLRPAPVFWTEALTSTARMQIPVTLISCYSRTNSSDCLSHCVVSSSRETTFYSLGWSPALHSIFFLR